MILSESVIIVVILLQGRSIDGYNSAEMLNNSCLIFM